jgi:hypothetical protein
MTSGSSADWLGASMSQEANEAAKASVIAEMLYIFFILNVVLGLEV